MRRDLQARAQKGRQGIPGALHPGTVMSATRSSEHHMPVSEYILMTSSESSFTRRADHASAREQRTIVESGRVV